MISQTRLDLAEWLRTQDLSKKETFLLDVQPRTLYPSHDGRTTMVFTADDGPLHWRGLLITDQTPGDILMRMEERPAIQIRVDSVEYREFAGLPPAYFIIGCVI